MDTNNILNDLRAQRERINNAIIALEGSVGNGRRGRPPASQAAAADGRRGRRRLSAAARKKISDAAKRRWAKVKRS